MGEMAEYFLNQEMFPNFDDQREEFSYTEAHQRLVDYFEDNLRRKVWVTHVGKSMYYHEMSDSHLNNTIALLDRKGPDSFFGFAGRMQEALEIERKERWARHGK